MSAFSDADRIRLTRLSEQVMDGPVARLTGNHVADHLRQALPDLDDVTIGRVALALGTFMDATVRQVSPLAQVLGIPLHDKADHLVVVMARQVLRAGLCLTEIEWREEPQ